MRQSKQKTCNQPLIVERYGGGSRYHCPVCDIGSNSNSIKVAYWTNGTPPVSLLCDKKTSKQITFRLERKFMSPLQLFDVVIIEKEPERGEWLVESFEYNNDARLKVRLLKSSFRTYKTIEEVVKVGSGVELALTSDLSYLREACKEWLASGEKVIKEKVESENYV